MIVLLAYLFLQIMFAVSFLCMSVYAYNNLEYKFIGGILFLFCLVEVFKMYHEWDSDKPLDYSVIKEISNITKIKMVYFVGTWLGFTCIIFSELIGIQFVFLVAILYCVINSDMDVKFYK